MSREKKEVQQVAKEEKKGPASLLPDDFAEGGGVPWNRNQTVIKARTLVFNYKSQGGVPWDTEADKSDPSAPGLELTFRDDEGTEYNPQFYSAGDLKKLVPSKDGKTPADVGEFLIKNPNFEGTGQITTGTNLAKLITAAIDAGMPKTALKSGNIAEAFQGTHGYWEGRSVEPVSGGKPKTTAFPGGGEFAMPGDKKGKKAADEDDEEDTAAAIKKAIKIVKSELKDKESISRADLQEVISTDYDDDEHAALMAKVIFKGDFKKALKKAGYALDGEDIQKAEEEED